MRPPHFQLLASLACNVAAPSPRPPPPTPPAPPPRPAQVLVYGDCAVNVSPSATDLAAIAATSADTAAAFGIEPRVAMLSYSTLGSGAGPDVSTRRGGVQRSATCVMCDTHKPVARAAAR